MRRPVAVIGLGHVGSVAAACLARRGHAIVGVDRDPQRVAAVNDGRAPVEEPRLAVIVAAARQAGHLRATPQLADAMRHARASLVCVGTPAAVDGASDLRELDDALVAIGLALRTAARRHVIVIRSTVPPGTTHAAARTVAQASGLEPGRDFGLCVNPEFLREGNAVEDFESPAAIVIGETDRRDGDLVLSLERRRRARSVTRCDPSTAEMLKYLHNSWNALRVSFGNEMGAAAEALGADAHAALTAFAGNATGAMDPGYLMPGAPWGGACLRKDLDALRIASTRAGVAAPLLDAIGSSNVTHLDRCLSRVLAHNARRIALVGLAFKPGTADLRDSPYVALARRLARHAEVKVYDVLVAEADVPPDLRALRGPSLDALLAASDLVVLCHGDAATRARIDALAAHLPCVDLASPTQAATPLAPGNAAAA